MSTQIQCIAEAVASIDDPPASTPHREQLVESIRGKYKHVSTSSDAFQRRKEEDCALES